MAGRGKRKSASDEQAPSPTQPVLTPEIKNPPQKFPLPYSPWHEEVVRLACQGMSYVDIAQRLDKKTYVIQELAQTEWFARRLAQVQNKLDIDFSARMADLWELTALAIEGQRLILQTFVDGAFLPNAQQPSIQQFLSLSNTLLDRFGMKSPDKLEINQNVTTRRELSYEERLNLIRQYKELDAPIPEDLAMVSLGGGNV